MIILIRHQFQLNSRLFICTMENNVGNIVSFAYHLQVSPGERKRKSIKKIEVNSEASWMMCYNLQFILCNNIEENWSFESVKTSTTYKRVGAQIWNVDKEEMHCNNGIDNKERHDYFSKRSSRLFPILGSYNALILHQKCPTSDPRCRNCAD